MQGPSIGTYNRNLGSQFGKASDLYSNLGSLSSIVGSQTPLSNRIISELTNYLGNAGSIANNLKSFYGAGPSLAQKQLESQVGSDIQKRGEKAVADIRENPYAGGTRTGVNMLGEYLAPMETGLYTQRAQDEANRQGLGLNALGAQMNIPSMYTSMLAPEQLKIGNQFNYDQLNSNIAMQNIMNQLAAAGGLGNLSQLLANSQEVFMQPDAMSQFLQALLGGVFSGAGQLASKAIPQAT